MMTFKAKRVSCVDDQQLIKELKLGGVLCNSNALIGEIRHFMELRDAGLFCEDVVHREHFKLLLHGFSAIMNKHSTKIPMAETKRY